MRLRQPVQLDLRSILEAAFEAKDECPEMFMGFMGQQFVEDGWHEQKSGDQWAWHASALSDCLRASVYKHRGTDREPQRVESNLTFSIGHLYHALIQFGLAVHPDYELIGHEIGGKYNDLAARCDAVFLAGDSVILIDVKSEATNSGAMRRKDAERLERKSSARPDHELQVKATQIVLRELHSITVDEAWICYVDKDNGDVDQQPVDLARGEVDVAGRMEVLNLAVKSNLLPDVLPLEEKVNRKREKYMAPNWRCSPRSDSDPRGKYCPYRGMCDPEANRKAS